MGIKKKERYLVSMKRADKREINLNRSSLKEYDFNKSPVGCAPCLKEALKIDRQVNKKTLRIHTSYSMAATSTGRLSSTDPNLQNIPIRSEEGKKIRNTFISRDGFKLVSLDYSQIELRLLAHIGKVEDLKKAFDQNIDVHKKTAS